MHDTYFSTKDLLVAIVITQFISFIHISNGINFQVHAFKLYFAVRTLVFIIDVFSNARGVCTIHTVRNIFCSKLIKESSPLSLACEAI